MSCEADSFNVGLLLVFMSSVLHVRAMDDIFLSLTRSLTPLLVRFVTTGYAMRAPFKFSFKSIGFPRTKHHFGFIFVKACHTSAKYLSAGNANHRTF